MKAKPVDDKRKCRECGERKPESQTFTCGHMGGGNYCRPSRVYRSTICLDCAKTILDSDGAKYAEKHHLLMADHWSLAGLRAGVRMRAERRA